MIESEKMDKASKLLQEISSIADKIKEVEKDFYEIVFGDKEETTEDEEMEEDEDE